MRVVGYCTTGHHVRMVQVSSHALAMASAGKGIVEGECDSCRREREEREKKEGRRA